jgi:hypothetical protein
MLTIGAIALALLAATNAPSPTPKVRVVLQERAFSVASSAAVPVINTLLSKLAASGKLYVDDISIDVETHKIGIGKVQLNVTDITIAMISFGTNGTQIELLDPGTPGDARFRLDLASLALNLNANFRVKDVGGIIKTSDHGYVNLTARQGSCDIDMSLAPDGLKQPHLHSTVSLNVPDFHYKFHGKLSWLYQALGSALHGIIRNLVEKKITAALLNITDNVLPAIIDNLPTEVAVGGGKSRVGLGVGLEGFVEQATAPLSLSSGIDLSITNSLTSAGCPMQTPKFLTPLPALAPRSDGAMIQILISESVATCVSWVFFDNGLLDIPHLKFGTTQTPWGLLLPALKRKYPSTPLDVVLRLTPLYAPNLKSFRTGGVHGAAGFHVNMSVNDTTTSPQGVLVYADTLEVDVLFGIDVSVQTLPGGANATLIGNVSYMNLTAAVVDSAVPGMSGGVLKLFSSLFEGIVRNLINGILSKGVPISPSGGLLHNATVFTEDGFITIATDFAFGEHPKLGGLVAKYM